MLLSTEKFILSYFESCVHQQKIKEAAVCGTTHTVVVEFGKSGNRRQTPSAISICLLLNFSIFYSVRVMLPRR
jgi:hypothetical protein